MRHTFVYYKIMSLDYERQRYSIADELVRQFEQSNYHGSWDKAWWQMNRQTGNEVLVIRSLLYVGNYHVFDKSFSMVIGSTLMPK